MKAIIDYRGVINGKAGKAAALPKFSDTLTLSQPGRADYAHPLAFLAWKKSLITPMACVKVTCLLISRIYHSLDSEKKTSELS